MGKKRGNDYGRKKKEGKITGGKRMWERLRLKKEKQLWFEKERVIYYRGIRKRKDYMGEKERGKECWLKERKILRVKKEEDKETGERRNRKYSLVKMKYG